MARMIDLRIFNDHGRLHVCRTRLRYGKKYDEHLVIRESDGEPRWIPHEQGAIVATFCEIPEDRQKGWAPE